MISDWLVHRKQTANGNAPDTHVTHQAPPVNQTQYYASSANHFRPTPQSDNQQAPPTTVEHVSEATYEPPTGKTI